MRRKNRLLFALMGVALLSACQKEPSDILVLSSEGFSSGDTKMAVSGNTLSWVTGDEVRVNGQTAEVTADGSSASIPMGSLSAPFRAIYPASLNPSAALNSNTVTLTFPAVYTYRATDGGQQNLDAPMAAYAESGNKLFFKHLTGAISVKLTNNTLVGGFGITSITVISDKYQLSGSKSINFSNLTSISPALGATEADRSVTMVFDTPLNVDGYSGTTVQIPILPVGDDNKFTVVVTTRLDDGSLGGYKVTKSTNSGALGRAKISGFGVTVNRWMWGTGCFSIDATHTVRFAKGNLQYQASTNKWRFAEHQYDICGGDNANVSSSYSGWVDLFCWGTSGWSGSGATSYHPYDNVDNDNNYFAGALEGSYKDADWGWYNRSRIENATNSSYYNNSDGISNWRTLTYSEWNYILNTRANAASKQGYACIDGQYYGLVLLPDVWTLPPDLSFTSGAVQWESVPNNYSLAEWSRMEAAGALFLPAAGYRYPLYGTTIIGYYGPGRSISSLVGCYWTSSYGNNYNINPDEVYFQGQYGIGTRDGRRKYGDAVRLAKVNMLQSDEDED